MCSLETCIFKGSGHEKNPHKKNKLPLGWFAANTGPVPDRGDGHKERQLNNNGGSKMTIEEKIQQGAALKAQIDTLTEQLRSINLELSKQAEYQDGSKTGYVVGGGYKVKVIMRDNVRWDQARIAQIISHLPAAKECFKTEYKPDNKKLVIAMAKDEEVEKAIDWARTITPGAPAVTYEPLEEKF